MDSAALEKDLDALATEGTQLLAKAVEKDDFGKRRGIDHVSYESWFSRAARAVRDILPERHVEFVELYRLPKRPTKLEIGSYTISDYLSGVTLTYHDSENLVLTRFYQQVAILKSAKDVLVSRVAGIRGVVRSELFDDEISVASELRSKGHFRAAGAVAGVVLERHLKDVAERHKVIIRKKSPTLGDLNDALKNADVYDVPTWRRLQLLTDLRNLSVHEKGREPTAEEMQDLIDGVNRIIKSIF